MTNRERERERERKRERERGRKKAGDRRNSQGEERRSVSVKKNM